MEGEKGQEKVPKITGQITITLFEGGEFKVHGPMNNKVLFLGMLEFAKATALREEKKIQPASGFFIPPGVLKN